MTNDRRMRQAELATLTGRYCCMNCGDECGLIIADLGIGSYEYWGSKGVDVNLQIVSDCCESSFMEVTDDETD